MKTMFRKTGLVAALVSGLLGGLVTGAHAAGPATELKSVDWSFDGIFGQYDRAALQRGLQVYQQACSACHGLKRVAFRNLGDLGFSEAEIQALAGAYVVEGGPDEYGDMFERPAAPFDRFPSPFPNEQAARAANSGAYPPDLSLIAKARAGGADYIYSLMTGYDDPPADMELSPGMSYNHYFSGNQIAMVRPLYDDMMEFADNTPASTEQMARDVSHFLMWAAEPHLEARKSMGLRVVLFLIILTGLLYLVNRKVWKPVKRGEQV